MADDEPKKGIGDGNMAADLKESNNEMKPCSEAEGIMPTVV